MRLAKEIDGNMEIVNIPLFPFRLSGGRVPGGADVLLGIGGNIGDVERRFIRLFYYLKRSPFVSIVQTSPLLRNPPFGYLAQPYFTNALMYARTDLDPSGLLRFVLHTEKRFGRKRSFANAPRTLDIDIIFYSNRHIDTPRLKIPHPEWRERDSVTIPMKMMKGLPWSVKRL